MGGLRAIEVIQIAAAALGILVSVYAVSIAQRDLWNVAVDTGQLIDDTVGRIRRRREIMRVLKHLGLFLGGVIITSWRVKHEPLLRQFALNAGANDYSSLVSYYTARITMTYVSLLTVTETIFEQFDRYKIGRLNDIAFARLRDETRLHAVRRDRRRTDPNVVIVVKPEDPT